MFKLPNRVVQNWAQVQTNFLKLEEWLKGVNNRLIRIESPEAWRIVGAAGQPSYQNGWMDYGAGHPGASFCKIGEIVYLRGLVMRPTSGASTIFTLPVGYRPPVQIYFITFVGGANVGFRVNSNGAITIDNYPTANSYVVLNNLWFRI